MLRILFCIVATLVFLSCAETTPASTVKVVGKMSTVMKQGQLNGQIATDSLNTDGAYGLGPIEYLQGEILLLEGQTYISKVLDSTSHKVTLASSAKAPFFVYTTTSQLHHVHLLPGYYTLQQLENQIDSIYNGYNEPLLVRIDGEFNNVKVHSVNLPHGTKVASPDDAHKGLTSYKYNNLRGTLIGFFSRRHKSIFTHHDSFFHAHFISQNRNIMGHVDELHVNAKAIYLKVSK